jgi:predicted AAA+ superfamily ATPase
MKNTIKLSIINDLKEGLDQKSPHLIQVILGPRQVGKTTSVLDFLENEYEKAFIYVSSDKIFNASPQWLKEQWQSAREKKALLVIDEIQKVENWSEAIKALWDEDKKNKLSIQCVLLGSSSLEIQKGLTESLTGRFRLIKAYHWNFHESQKGYSLTFEEFLKFGGYPGSYDFIRQEKEWINYVKHSIIETVIEKDILQNQTVKSPALFKQAFEILMSYPAQEISYTKLLGQLQDRGNTEVIKHYIKLYEGAFLLKVLEKFAGSKIRIKSSSPKILPLAPALYFSTIQDNYTNEERGRVFEMIVGSQLVRAGLDIFYWREKNDEVDFVVKQGRKIWAIEVKSSRKKGVKGLDKFKQTFPQAKTLFITPENYFQFELDPILFLENQL